MNNDLSCFIQKGVDLKHTGLVQNTLALVDGFTGGAEMYFMWSANNMLGS